MIDTVTLFLETYDSEKAEAALSSQKESVNRDTGEVAVNGLFESLRVKITGQGVSVNGSLSGFYHGSNSVDLTRADTGRAIEKISDGLHLPMNQAKVYRLDAAQNLSMNKPVTAYLSQLISTPYLKRSEHGDGSTVNFSSKKRALVFYDKVASITAKHQAMPEGFRGSNILRYENRALRNAAKQFNREEILAGDLSQEAFFNRIIDKWLADYSSVKKIRRPQDINFQSVRTLETSIARHGLPECGGHDNLIRLIKAEQKQGRASKMKALRLREKIKSLAIAPCNEDKTDDIAELDEKINHSAEACR
jgi:hypothetical protein